MAIRYDKKLEQEINKTIRNFNQKVARLEKQERDLLPSKISKTTLKNSVYTRAELTRKLKELQRFSSRNVEDIVETKGGVRITKYELNNLKRENARIKRNITKEINRLTINKPKVFGKTQSSTFSEMGDTEYLNLIARRKALDKDINKISKDTFERLKKLIERTGRNQQYMNNVFKENYFTMLKDMAFYIGYDQSKLKYIQDKLMKLPPNNFLKLFKEDKSIRAILDYYPMMQFKFNQNTGFFVNPEDYQEDIINLYDALYDNIDEIVKDYA